MDIKESLELFNEIQKEIDVIDGATRIPLRITHEREEVDGVYNVLSVNLKTRIDALPDDNKVTLNLNLLDKLKI